MVTGASHRKSRGGQDGSDPLALLGAAIVQNLPDRDEIDQTLIAQALHDVLDHDDPDSRALRLQFQIYLLSVNDSLLDEPGATP